MYYCDCGKRVVGAYFFIVEENIWTDSLGKKHIERIAVRVCKNCYENVK